MRRASAAALAALAFVLIGPALAGPMALVSGHAQLVSSAPGAGQALDAGEAPAELRLAFSEPLVAQYSSLDLTTSIGGVILENAGAPDPADPRTLVAAVPFALADGTYMVSWRTLSAADGHAASGFFSFAVGGSGVIAGGDHGHAGTTTHAHDDPLVRAFEVGARGAAYGGLLVAFGLGVLGFAFGRSSPRLRTGAADAVWISLIAAAAGTAGMLVLAAALLPSPAGGGAIDVAAYATGVRTGQLMTLRLALALFGAVAAFALATSGRAAPALLVAVAVSLAGFATVALGGHQAAFASPIPALVDVVHLGSAGLWLAGVGAVAWFALRRVPRDELVGVVSRFSAVALVSVALLGLTGTYQAWIGLGSLTEELGSEFGTALVAKVAVFAIAIAIGALNYLDGGREMSAGRTGRRWFGSFRTRVIAEIGLAVAVVVLSANLTVASPPGPTRAIGLAPAVAADSSQAALALFDDRPGPNGFVARLTAPVPAGSIAELLVRRIDVDEGASRIRLTAEGGDGRQFSAGGALLAPDSQWDATLVVTDAAGAEPVRERFRFSFDTTGLTSGRRLPDIDPAVLVALALVAAAVIGLTFGVAGGRLPRTNAAASRGALLVGGLVGGLLGLGILIGGPH